MNTPDFVVCHSPPRLTDPCESLGQVWRKLPDRKFCSGYYYDLPQHTDRAADSSQPPLPGWAGAVALHLNRRNACCYVRLSDGCMLTRTGITYSTKFLRGKTSHTKYGGQSLPSPFFWGGQTRSLMKSSCVGSVAASAYTCPRN